MTHSYVGMSDTSKLLELMRTPGSVMAVCVCSLQAALTITRSFRLAVRMKKKAEERDRLSVFAVKIQSAYRRHQVSSRGDVTSRTVATHPALQ